MKNWALTKRKVVDQKTRIKCSGTVHEGESRFGRETGVHASRVGKKADGDGNSTIAIRMISRNKLSNDETLSVYLLYCLFL